jgi:hypothetical protein
MPVAFGQCRALVKIWSQTERVNEPVCARRSEPNREYN